ncbi:conserved hypothetical protein [Prochlorococcus marinus str. MIT 9515]|uniref:Uncharacterized protein n=1 Tax=Prochlorococcus marinus (strain MIT 9515) TaxID=167542 RepID=A2BW37_PROM5|nr:hypothetical protein [Prochlorococcus marinus]ABM71998.1 conserved hypothetical protein [Prochlorococcus marinus str. MIT 9515]
MKQDTNHVLNYNDDKKATFEELHIRHLNLLLDLRSKKLNNWFLKMAIINTFDDLKIFLNHLKKNKHKCIIAIKEKKIIGYLNIFPLNDKGTCLKISNPNLIKINSSINEKDLIVGLIKKAISITDMKTSSWVINSDLENNHLISSARELGFQPLDKVKLWSKNKINKSINNANKNSYSIDEFQKINKLNFINVLNFIRSNQSPLTRAILDLSQKDISNRNDLNSGAVIYSDSVLCTILKDINFQDSRIYTLTIGRCWDNRLNPILKDILNNFFEKSPQSIIKTHEENTELNSYLENSGFTDKFQEIILVRNTIIRNEYKQTNKINQSLESIFGKLNPQGNAYPSPFPLKSK